MTTQPALLDLDFFEVVEEVTTAPSPAPRPVLDENGMPPVWVTYPAWAPDQTPALPADPKVLLRMVLEWHEHMRRTVHPALFVDPFLGWQQRAQPWYDAARRYLDQSV